MVQGWYIVPSVEHYWFYKVYISNTRAYRIADTVELFPDNTTIPVLYSANAATHAATDFIRALKNPTPAALVLTLGTEAFDALRNLVDKFKGNITVKTKLETSEIQIRIVEQKIEPRHLRR